MINIAFIAPWWKNPKEAREQLAIQTPSGSAVWGQIRAVDSVDDADVFVIWQRDTNLSKNLPMEKKIYLQREPDVIEVPEHLNTKREALFVCTYERCFQYTKWWVDKNYDQLKEQQYPAKSKVINTVLSHKRSTFGHIARTDFMTEYLSKYPDSIDVFGTFNSIHPFLNRGLDSRFWKSINNFILTYIPKKTNKSDKFDLTLPYKYSFVAENCQQKNYFTEKIADSYLSWSMPVYWGCPNISDYFPDDSYYTIDITKNNAVKELYNIIKRPLTKKNINAIKEARLRILDSYNVWPALNNVLSK